MSSRLAPGFVAASPQITDGSFSRSIVLLLEDGADGSFGFVINRPSPLRFRALAESMGISTELSLPVYEGGPVSTETGWVIFDPACHPPEALEDALLVRPGLAVSASRNFLKQLANSPACPDRTALILGYAGWSRGQLEAEFKSGSWIPLEWRDGLVFEPDDVNWSTELKSIGIEPGRYLVSPSIQA